MMMKDKLRNEGLQVVVFGEIQKITEKGCIGGDGKEHPADILICATGFNTSYRPHFPIIGPSGQSLSDVWAEEAKSYLGIDTQTRITS